MIQDLKLDCVVVKEVKESEIEVSSVTKHT